MQNESEITITVLRIQWKVPITHIHNFFSFTSDVGKQLLASRMLA
jgi:hypothetical protein